MKVNPKIYKIDKSKRLLKTYANSEEICKAIVKVSRLKSDPKFQLRETDYRIERDDENDLWFFLYIYKTQDVESEWINFFPSNFTKDADFNQQKVSLIFFVEFQKQLYCIIGGSAFRYIQPYIEEDFGINIYSRILDPENDELLSIRTRNITGKIAVNSNYYKNNFKLIDHIKFGTVPTEISVKLHNDINDYFSSLKKDTGNVQIHVSSSIKFRKVIEYVDLIEVVKELKFIEELERKDYLTTYEKINDYNLIENTFTETLVTTIFNDVNNTLQATINPINKFHFEFCHPSKLEEFYEADYFELLELDDDKKQNLFAKINDRNRIYFQVLSRAVNRFGANMAIDEFKYFLFGVRVRSYKNGVRKNLTSGMFLHHFNTELEINQRPIFLLDNNWYFLQDSFLKDLNRTCERILKNFKAPNSLLTKIWNLKKENTEKKYNLLYKDLKNYLVFDTIAISGIELCDIIKYDAQNVYLIHVKRGFDSSMRELYNQIILSARRVEESRSSTDKTYLKNCFNSLIKKKQGNSIDSVENFLELFQKNIKYVMAFSNSNSNNAIEDQIGKVKSSIAKFSVIQTSSEMRSNYFELLFTQIEHS
ncbi:DUF6119 family protein [Flavobacterium hydrophilum]|uniref:Uncharacterized protein n=1 Tax=Flavobacterium hydrophilum TaxID=2211445 RepID=A0A2V4BXG7_9FLAO|nr:DUF6119 family protein [Flavobacterium hydrophilum]PXY43347.1 hypothetical protein DMB68_20085 [Flavobacterium hydrophilum]